MKKSISSSISSLSKDISSLIKDSDTLLSKEPAAKDIVSTVLTMFADELTTNITQFKHDLEILNRFVALTSKCASYKLDKTTENTPVIEPEVAEKPVKRSYVRKIKVEPIPEEKPKKRAYVRKIKEVENQPIDAEQPVIEELFKQDILDLKNTALNEPVFDKVENNAWIDLKNTDSLHGMKSLSDGCVDLVLSDPPYGIASKNKKTMRKGELINTMEAWGNDFQDAWSNVEEYWEWFKPFVAEMFRVMKDGASMILFLDRKYIGLITHNIEKEFKLKFKNNLYFVKSNPCPSVFRNQYRSNMETAVWFCKGTAKTFNFGEQKDMKQTFLGSLGKKFFLDGESHPTEKYAFMIEPLIANHSKKGQTVLDPFSGSGTTLIHAKRQNRNSIGFELNSKFYNIAKTRVEHENIEYKAVA